VTGCSSAQKRIIKKVEKISLPQRLQCCREVLPNIIKAADEKALCLLQDPLMVLQK
jgi:hypothetical protein